MHLKMFYVKWRIFCLGLNALITYLYVVIVYDEIFIYMLTYNSGKFYRNVTIVLYWWLILLCQNISAPKDNISTNILAENCSIRFLCTDYAVTTGFLLNFRKMHLWFKPLVTNKNSGMLIEICVRLQNKRVSASGNGSLCSASKTFLWTLKRSNTF